MQPTPASGPAGETNQIPAEARSDQSGCRKGEDARIQDWWRPKQLKWHISALLLNRAFNLTFRQSVDQSAVCGTVCHRDGFTSLQT